MPWTRLDDAFSDHPKMQQVGPLAELMQVRALLYSNRYLTDGHIPVSVLETLARGLSAYRENGRRVTPLWLAEKLVAAGVWEQVADGFRIHDYDQYQPARVKVLAERVAAKDRMQKSRGSPNVRPNIDRSSPEVRPKFGDPVPVPVPVKASSNPPEDTNAVAAFWQERVGKPMTHSDRERVLASFEDGITEKHYAVSVSNWRAAIDRALAERPDIVSVAYVLAPSKRDGAEFVCILEQERLRELQAAQAARHQAFKREDAPTAVRSGGDLERISPAVVACALPARAV